MVIKDRSCMKHELTDIHKNKLNSVSNRSTMNTNGQSLEVGSTMLLAHSH